MLAIRMGKQKPPEGGFAFFALLAAHPFQTAWGFRLTG
jgi:hypothetical protein